MNFEFPTHLVSQSSALQNRIEGLLHNLQQLEDLRLQLSERLAYERNRCEETLRELEDGDLDCAANQSAAAGVDHYLQAVEAMEQALESGVLTPYREDVRRFCAEGDRLLGCAEGLSETLRDECINDYLDSVAA